MAVVYSKVLLFDPPLIYTAPDTCVFGAVGKRKCVFHVHYFNMEISVNISHKPIKFETCTLRDRLREPLL